MKREIKFRAWDKINNQWIYANVLDVGKYKDLIDPEKICEFTGLKGRKGEEIYEGDIIQYHYFQKWDKDEYTEDDEICVGSVEFKECGFCVMGNDYVPFLINTCIDWVEVIGNIYENPGLLK